MALLIWLRSSGYAMGIGVLVAIAAYIYMNIIAADHNEEVCGLLKQQTYVLYSRRVVTPSGIIAAAVGVSNGKIAYVRKTDRPPSYEKKEDGIIFDYGDRVIMPGLIDIHVHLNEPGREEWEGVKSGTRAAAAGGITTVVDMPLNSFPVTSSVENLAAKVEATKNKLFCDIGFWGGLVPENAENLTALDNLLKAGVLGLKSFMCPSGINDFPATTAEHIKAALVVLAKYKRPVFVHAELPQPVADPAPAVSTSVSDEDPRVYSTYLKSRPPSWEQAAIRQLIRVGESTKKGEEAEGASIHIAHLSDVDCLPMIKDAKSRGVNLTVETCTHYLTFAAEEIEDGDTRFKCAPPIRGRENRRMLWEALMNGEIDSLSSDHSPAPPELKCLEEGDFMRAWGGISSLQFGPLATWTYGKRRQGLSLEQLVHWWSTKPARIAGLTNKGSLEVGYDADIVVWNPEGITKIVDHKAIYHKHKMTPFFNMTLDGTIDFTFLRGQLMFSQAQFSDSCCGRPILK